MGALPILFRGGSASKKDGCLLPRVPLRPPFPFSKGSGQGCPLLRASNEHIHIVRVLRARRAPGHSLPTSQRE